MQNGFNQNFYFLSRKAGKAEEEIDVNEDGCSLQTLPTFDEN